jgi:dolichyl-phosphate beta-glucosyltransferase
MTPRSLTIVLPAFNEAERLGPALDELFAYLDRPRDASSDGVSLPAEIEVLVVDDGSSDGTADLVRARPSRAGTRGHCGS